MIPKIIHQIWIQGYSDLSLKYQKNVNSWQRIHPKYEYYFWDDKRLSKFIGEKFPQYLSVYQKENKNNKSNIGRYLLLREYGGLYADIDSYPRKSLEIFFAMNIDVIMGGEIFHKYNAAISLSKPNLGLWIDIMDYAINRTDYFITNPTEPFGMNSLNRYFENHETSSVLTFPTVYFLNEEEIDDPRQYVIHTKDRNWRAFWDEKLK